MTLPELNPSTRGNSPMSTLFILNDPPYGTERVYNGLRLAANMQRLDEGHEMVVFLMGDAAAAAKSGQVVPNGYYNINKMLGNVLRRGGRVLVCGTCMDARGLTQEDLISGAMRSTLDELTQITLAAGKVLVF
ncbi:MAG: DsrE family protein [Candidatus Nanopelagicales bacterium]